MNGSETMAAHLGHQSAPSARPNLAELVNAALRSRRKVFLMDFELRFPLDMPTPDNDGAIEACLKTLDEKFGPEGLALDPRLIWHHPQEGGKSPRYRYTLVVNCARPGGVYGALVIVQEAWNLALGLPRKPNYGLVEHGRFGDEGGVMLWRDDYLFEDKLKDCLDWMS